MQRETKSVILVVGGRNRRGKERKEGEGGEEERERLKGRRLSDSNECLDMPGV